MTTNTKSRTVSFIAKRKYAEGVIQKQEAALSDNLADLSPEEIQRTFHELRVLQVKLEKRNEELRLTQAAQIQKMESIERLAGSVANDFNNLLGIILGHVEMALDHADPDQPFFANLQEIGRAVDRSAQLTLQLLSFARMQIDVADGLDLNKNIERSLGNLQCLIGKDIDLVWRPEASLWPVAIDSFHIEQILVNLCINARNAITGIGHITIETKNVSLVPGETAVHPDCPPGDYVALIVSDHGCGFAHDALGKLFAPFFTTKETVQGSGLGLAVVAGIIEQNNGFINVFSKPAQGTTFEIYLRRYPVQADQLSQINRKRLPPNKPANSGVSSQWHGREREVLHMDVIVPDSSKAKVIH
jgi:signal transduction histidine kinase